MSNSSFESKNLEYVSQLLQTAAKIIVGFPQNYAPQAPEIPHSAEAFMKGEDRAALNDPALRDWLNKVMKGLPAARWAPSSNAVPRQN